MSTTNGTMKSFKVTDKDGNVYVMIPVDTVAQQAIDEAKLMNFDEDYFMSEPSQDQKTVNIGLNGVPIGVESPLKFVQDTPQGIVLGSSFALFIITPSSVPPVADLYAARDADKALFLMCGVDITVGSYTLEKSTILSLCWDTARPGYATHSFEFTCTGTFGGGTDNVTIKCCINGDNSVTWSAFATNGLGDGGALTDAASINVPNNAISTLSTAQAALTLNVNVGSGEVPNFAVEITPSVDVTLTVTKTVGNTTTTLNPSTAGGNSLTTGKLYQVTCVGSCWTLAEFTVPTP